MKTQGTNAAHASRATTTTSAANEPHRLQRIQRTRRDFRVTSQFSVLNLRTQSITVRLGLSSTTVPQVPHLPLVRQVLRQRSEFLQPSRELWRPPRENSSQRPASRLRSHLTCRSRRTRQQSETRPLGHFCFALRHRLSCLLAFCFPSCASLSCAFLVLYFGTFDSPSVHGCRLILNHVQPMIVVGLFGR